ncbi:hypothetical protein [Methanolobus chelungpuianus]|nr:hypothetical protein [Methanolobus chelungpuianus]
MSLDLSKRVFENQETIELTISKEKENSIWLRFLGFIGFDTFLKWEYPIGTNIDMERDYTEFKKVESEDKLQSKVAQAKIKLTGRRQLTLNTFLESNTSFVGKDFLHLKIYIGPKSKYLRCIIKFELCKQSIEILPYNG